MSCGSQRLGIKIGTGFPDLSIHDPEEIENRNDYLTAAALRLFGFDLGVARAVSLLFGVFTVLLTYWLARELRPARVVALVAAALIGA